MSLETYIIREQAYHVFESSLRSAIALLITVTLFYPLFVDHLDRTLFLFWCSSIIILSLFKLIFSWQYKKRQPMNVAPWLHALTLVSFVTGTLWACFTLFFFTVSELGFQYLFIILACGMAAASVAVYASWPPAFYAYLLPQSISILIITFYATHTFLSLLIVSILAIFLILILSQKGLNKNIRHKYTLQYNNKQLILDLKNEIARREYIIEEKTTELNENLYRLDFALKAAHQTWFDLNLQTGEARLGREDFNVSEEVTIKKTKFGNWQDKIHPDDREHVLHALQQFTSKKQPHHLGLEYRLISSEGESIWVHSFGEVAEWDNDNKARRVIGIHTDITQRKKAEITLAESQNILKTVIDTAPIRIFWKDRDLNYLGCNLAFAHDAGLSSPEEIIGKNDSQLTWHEQAEMYRNDDNSVINSGIAKISHEELQTIPNGKKRWFSTSKVPLRDGPSNEIFGLLGIYEDITKRKESEEFIRLSSRVFSETHGGITITNAKGVIIDANPAFCTTSGYSRKEIIGQKTNLLNSGRQEPDFYTDMWQAINEHGHWQGEIWNRKKSGELYAELLSISTLLDEEGHVKNYVGISSDITQSKQQQEKLNLMAHYDVLTKLPNRALFVDRFHLATAHSKRTRHLLAVCFLDLDNFKPINDNFGHEAGDKLLIEVAQRITACIREDDTVSRQGGDEFALLLNDLESVEQCNHTLERILATLSQPYLIDDHAHKIAASIGVTLYPEDEGDIDTLLRHADQAMYLAKQSGKGKYQFFNAQQDQEKFRKHTRLSEVEQALSNNELILYYQPKVNMVTGKVFGVEALIRWLHPEKGLISPLDFLPPLDGTDLEVHLGDWVINEALQQMDSWQQQGLSLEVSVSVNIASHHLHSDTFFTHLDKALSKYPTVDPQYLQLEILESSALGDLQTVSRIIKSCQNGLGVRIALDDFGTGYSSLTHLRSLSANTIKIDQSFVLNMLNDPSDYTIVDGIISLAAAFGHSVIAEGVETVEHGLMLLSMGCEEAQGYSIAKPLPANKFPEWLNNYIPNKAWQNYDHKSRSSKENKIKLLQILTEHWKTHFLKNIESSPEDVEFWPIMNGHECPCGNWINRVEQEQLFESTTIEQLKHTHNNVHAIAQTVQLNYLQGSESLARDDLAELKEAFNTMNSTLEQCK
ncbi:MAG: EAL domain-containing protein [Methylococcaceae bacterium]|nr:EAL domain-containing protein [Methylococcaceae bacterium]